MGVLALLILAAFAAGLVDAVAGGGGVITLPALMAAGLPPAAAIATNKGQAVFGSLSSLAAFARGGAVDRRRAPYSFVAAAIGSLLGARLVLLLDPRVLRPLVLVLLLFASAAAFLRRPRNDAPRADAPFAGAERSFAFGLALVIGAYDGFFGPGTGTFLLLGYAYLFGDPMLRATGNAKVANFASNLAAFALFAAAGAIRWELALPMAVAQAAGSLLGARLAIRKGAPLVRAMAAAVSLVLAGRIAWQLASG